MQTATTIKAQRSFADKVEPKLGKLVDLSATVFLGTFSAGTFYVAALLFAEGGMASILLGVALCAGGVMFLTMALQSLIEVFS